MVLLLLEVMTQTLTLAYWLSTLPNITLSAKLLEHLKLLMVTSETSTSRLVLDLTLLPRFTLKQLETYALMLLLPETTITSSELWDVQLLTLHLNVPYRPELTAVLLVRRYKRRR